MKISGSLWPSF